MHCADICEGTVHACACLLIAQFESGRLEESEKGNNGSLFVAHRLWVEDELSGARGVYRCVVLLTNRTHRSVHRAPSWKSRDECLEGAVSDHRLVHACLAQACKRGFFFRVRPETCRCMVAPSLHTSVSGKSLDSLCLSV